MATSVEIERKNLLFLQFANLANIIWMQFSSKQQISQSEFIAINVEAEAILIHKLYRQYWIYCVIYLTNNLYTRTQALESRYWEIAKFIEWQNVSRKLHPK